MRNFCNKLRFDSRGQDIIGYALLIGLVGLAFVALFPGVTNGVWKVMVKINHALVAAGGNALFSPAGDENASIRIAGAILAALLLVAIVLRRRRAEE